MLDNFHCDIIDLYVISYLNQIYIEHYNMFIQVQFFHTILYINFVIR